jgi:hypothetical protein
MGSNIRSGNITDLYSIIIHPSGKEKHDNIAKFALLCCNSSDNDVQREVSPQNTQIQCINPSRAAEKRKKEKNSQ